MSKADEPAFPMPGCELPNGHFEWPVFGLTKREYFAAAALPAVITQCARDPRNEDESIEEMFARKATACADALIAALKRKPE